MQSVKILEYTKTEQSAPDPNPQPFSCLRPLLGGVSSPLVNHRTNKCEQTSFVVITNICTRPSVVIFNLLKIGLLGS